MIRNDWKDRSGFYFELQMEIKDTAKLCLMREQFEGGVEQPKTVRILTNNEKLLISCRNILTVKFILFLFDTSFSAAESGAGSSSAKAVSENPSPEL